VSQLVDLLKEWIKKQENAFAHKDFIIYKEDADNVTITKHILLNKTHVLLDALQTKYGNTIDAHVLQVHIYLLETVFTVTNIKDLTVLYLDAYLTVDKILDGFLKKETANVYQDFIE
jgi:hypothetical protein